MTENTEPTPAQPGQVTPPQPPVEADIQERIDGFNKELLPLLGKYELGLAAIPKILPDGRVLADPIVISVRGRADLLKSQTQSKPAEAPVAPSGTTKAGLATGE